MRYVKSLLLVIFIFVLGYYLYGLKITEIRCYNQNGECSSSLQSKLKTNGIRLINVSNYIKNVLKSDFSVKEYHTQIIAPSIIKVDLIERTPKYALSNTTKDWMALIDEEGYVISFDQSTNLPLVIIDKESPKVGEKMASDIHFALNLMSDIYYNYKISTGTISGEVLQIDFDPNIQVYFPLNGDRQLLIGSLVLISKRMQNLTADFGSRRVIIDLRYKNPIIRT